MTGSRPAIRIDGDLIVPANVGSLQSFRRWCYSGSFPERGRIDFLNGTIEVEISPKDLQTHGKPKGALHAYIERAVSLENLGEVYVDRTRFKSADCGLSCEPDILFVSWKSLKSGRAKHVSSSAERPERMIEIEGSVDLVVEVVSDGSVDKDLNRLPPLYALAGVKEYWLVDARGKDLSFEIFLRRRMKWIAAKIDSNGFHKSEVLERLIRFRREAGLLAHTWRYFVDDRAV